MTDDGAETDLDLGHYERFIDENLTQLSNVTTGRIYQAVIAKAPRRLPSVGQFRSSPTSPTRSRSGSPAWPATATRM